MSVYYDITQKMNQNLRHSNKEHDTRHFYNIVPNCDIKKQVSRIIFIDNYSFSSTRIQSRLNDPVFFSWNKMLHDPITSFLVPVLILSSCIVSFSFLFVFVKERRGEQKKQGNKKCLPV